MIFYFDFVCWSILIKPVVIFRVMISKRQLEEWEKQSQKDKQQFKKDEEYLKSLENAEDNKIRSFFERMRSKYFNFRTEEHEKLNRLLQYTGFDSQIQNYPHILNRYITYNTSCLVLLGICMVAPKKLISKLVLSLMLYGFKVNIGDGLMTYYIIEQMALGNKMTLKEQQIRNVLEFYYLRNRFRQKPMNEEQQSQTQQMLEKIKEHNVRYQNFKKVESLL